MCSSSSRVAQVCVGSLWKSSRLLLRGFEEGLFPDAGPSTDVHFTVDLVTLRAPSAVGAAWVSAKVLLLPLRLCFCFRTGGFDALCDSG